MAGWYVRRGEKVAGPIDVAKLRELVAAGKLFPTDQLAKDAGGPWTEASRTELFSGQLGLLPVETSQPLPQSTSGLPAVPDQPIEQPPSTNKMTVMVQATVIFIRTIGRGTLAAGNAVGRTLSTRAQRRHEIKLAKIQAQALVDSKHLNAPQLTQPTVQQPVTFAPHIVQTTVVKVVNKNTGGCGCSGCASVILLILLGILACVIYTAYNSPK